MVDGHAVVGLSQARDNRTFQGLPLDDALKRHDAEPRCRLLVIDTANRAGIAGSAPASTWQSTAIPGPTNHSHNATHRGYTAAG